MVSSPYRKKKKRDVVSEKEEAKLSKKLESKVVSRQISGGDRWRKRKSCSSV